jgi:hypothetical protein
VRRSTVVAEARATAAPPGAAWVGDDEAAGVVARALGELGGGRPPWARRGWFATAERWLHATLAGLGSTATGPARQVRVWELSCIVRMPTTRGDVYLKASVASPLFVDEGAVMRALAELFPRQVPAPLAVDAEHGWTLLADFGAPLGWDGPAEVREDVLRTWAAIQIEAASRVDALLAAGCVDRRLHRLADQAQAWLPALDATGRLPTIDTATWLAAAEVDELRAAVPRLQAMCDELAASAVPASLVHGDLHPGNVARGPDGLLFFDWTNACVAYPFVDAVSMLQGEEDEELDAAVRARLRDAYLAAWAAVEPPERLLRAWRLVETLGPLHIAISYGSIVEHLVPPVEQHMAASTAFWLRKVLAGLRAPA